jgi:hypothetical protein
MDRSGLECPHCHVPLRVKDRGLVGHTFPCPDCGRPLRVMDGGESGLQLQAVPPQTHTASDPAVKQVTKATSQKVSAKKRTPQPEPSESETHGRGKQLARRAAELAATLLAFFREPLVLVWSSAILFAIVMLFLLAPWGGSTPVRRAESQRVPVAGAEVPGNVNGPNAARVQRPPVEAVRPELPPQIAEPVAQAEPAPNDAIERAPVEAARPAGIVVADVQPPPQGVRLDVKTALNQPIVRYEQTLAVPLGDLLLELEEMAAVPIFYDAERVAGLEGRLQKRVSFKAEQTTVGEILRLALKQAEMDFEVRQDGIHLRLQSDAAQPARTDVPKPPLPGDET